MRSGRIVTTSGILLVALLSGCGGGNSPDSPGSPGPGAAGSAATSATPSAPSSPSASPTPSGTPFTSAAWHFSMTFPDEPQQQDLQQAVKGVKIDGRLFEATSGTSDVAVTVVKFPAGQDVDVDGALTGAISGAAANTGGKVLEEHAETFQGRRARQGTVQAKGQTVYIEGVFDQNRLYGIIGSPRESFDDAKASFQFLP
jgi:hypothetical protein